MVIVFNGFLDQLDKKVLLDYLEFYTVSAPHDILQRTQQNLQKHS